MPFALINSTNPRTNPCNFGGNCSAFGGGWKTQFFLSRPFWIFFEFFFFLLHSHENMSKFIGLQGFFKIWMITLVSSPKQHLPKHMQHSVCRYISSQYWYLVFFDNLRFNYKREIILSIKPENSITEVIWIQGQRLKEWFVNLVVFSKLPNKSPPRTTLVQFFYKNWLLTHLAQI